MTEALEKWSIEKLGHHGEHEAEFWLRAFVALVNERANSRKPYPHARAEVVGEEFAQAVRELLGE